MKQLPHLCPFRRAREVCSCFQTPFLFNLPTLAVLPPTFTMISASKRPLKRHRRTATTVLAGDFDPRTTSDASTSLLNGISPCKAVDEDKETKRIKRREKRERGRERKRLKRKAEMESNSSRVTLAPTTTDKNNQPAFSRTSSFWRTRPTIQLSTFRCPMSITPPLSPRSTPQTSISSSTSQTSSKRPRTPDDEGLDDHGQLDSNASPQPQQSSVPRKKREPVKRGWKGWVEASPPPSDKLINLDSVPILRERRTRSGKNFKAIG
jgi:hypothetical protein